MGVVNLVLLACVLRATTKKGRQFFLERKLHPRDNPDYAYACQPRIKSKRMLCNDKLDKMKQINCAKIK